MISIIKSFFVCLGFMASGSVAIHLQSYWPLLISTIGLFGYLYCEFFVFKYKKIEDK